MNKIKLGIDLGGVVFERPLHNLFLNCMDILIDLNKKYEMYIISRVNSEQKEKSLVHLKKHDFFNITGIKKDNLYYCFERRDKSLFVKSLGIAIFIDDRPDVLSNMDNNVRKILFNPTYKDKVDFLKDIEKHKMELVENWIEIKNKLI